MLESIFFDNAEAYAGCEAEVVMGKVIKRAGWKRADLVLSTKIFGGALAPMTAVFLASTLSKALMPPYSAYKPIMLI